MPLDLYPIIKPLLTNHQSLYIPGLGTFTEKYIPAKEDTINGRLQPPDTVIVFEQGANGDITPLLSEVKNKFSVDEEEALASIRLFSKHLHQLLNQQHSIEIPNLGRLYYNVDRQISFVPKLKIFENTSFGLPEVPFNEQIFQRHSETVENIQTTPPPKPPNPIGKFILISFLFVLFSIGGYYLVSTPYVKEKWADMSAFLGSLSDRRFTVVKTEETVEVPTDTLTNTNDFPPEEDNEKVMPPPDTPEEMTQGQVVKIAIGVYGNPDNAARMVAKIEKAGFTSFTEKSGSLTKVGVEQTYKTMAEKLAIFDKVKAEIEKSAVIID
jgi:hypothetical protein